MFAGRYVAILCVLASLLQAQPAKTTIQDTLYKADGTPFNGTAVITWKTFQSADTSDIAMQRISTPIVNGALFVQLVPNTNATPVNYYTVHYNSDGREQFTEIWAVPPSARALPVSAVRVDPDSTPSGTGSGGTGSTGTGGSGAGGSTNPSGQTPIPEAVIVGLSSDLTIRPVKGPGFTPGRSAVINQAGEIEGVVGSPNDCVHVDGTSSPCAGQIPVFIDGETPSGLVNGINTSFTLANAPSPAPSLALFRNGMYQTAGADFSLTGSVIHFLSASTPQPGDMVTATYRTVAGSMTALVTTGTANILSSSALETVSNLSSGSTLGRGGHKTMVIGDSQVGPSTPDLPFPIIAGNWFGQLTVQSQSRIRYWGNVGVIGDTTAEMLNRLDTDVIPNNPDKVFIEAGFSDIAASVPVPTITANISAMITRLKNSGILPILCTLPPRADNSLTSGASSTVRLNFQLHQLAEAEGVPLADFYSVLVDARTGLYRAGYSTDGINPTMIAARVMAESAVEAVSTAYDSVSPWTPSTDVDGVNLILDPVFMQSASLWTQTTQAGVAANLSFAPDAKAGGNVMMLQKTDSGSVNVVTGKTVTSGFRPGDNLAFTGTISSSNCELGNLSFDVSLQFNPGAMTVYPIHHWAVDIARGQWYIELTVPAGATSMTPVFQLNQGTGSVSIGHIGVVNLTAMGN